MNYFFILKIVGASSQKVKCPISLPHDMTMSGQLCNVTMGR